MEKVVVIINEQHKLLEEQEEILKNSFGRWETLLVPAKGWSLGEQESILDSLINKTIVFASPIPFLIKRLSFVEGYAHEDNCIHANGLLEGHRTKVYVFHNDRREKLELPNGKVVHTVAKTGWQLV